MCEQMSSGLMALIVGRSFITRTFTSQVAGWRAHCHFHMRLCHLTTPSTKSPCQYHTTTHRNTQSLANLASANENWPKVNIRHCRSKIWQSKKVEQKRLQVWKHNIWGYESARQSAVELELEYARQSGLKVENRAFCCHRKRAFPLITRSSVERHH